MGDKVLLSTKHLNVTGNRKLVPSFVGQFSIVQWVGPLAYWITWEVNLCKNIHFFTFLFLSLFVKVVMDMHIQHLFMSKMSKNDKSVEFFNIKYHVEEGSV